MANGSSDDTPPVLQWTVQKGASKRGKDMLVESQGYSYIVGMVGIYNMVTSKCCDALMLIFRIINQLTSITLLF